MLHLQTRKISQFPCHHSHQLLLGSSPMVPNLPIPEVKNFKKTSTDIEMLEVEKVKMHASKIHTQVCIYVYITYLCIQ